MTTGPMPQRLEPTKEANDSKGGKNWIMNQKENKMENEMETENMQSL